MRIAEHERGRCPLSRSVPPPSRRQEERRSGDQSRGRRTTAGPARAPTGLARLRAGLARARRLWRDFTGESAYDRYVERHRREHPDHEPMSERQWWRARADFDDCNVSTGCC